MKTFATPVAVDAATAADNFQLELLDMHSDIELKQAFQGEDLLDCWESIAAL